MGLCAEQGKGGGGFRVVVMAKEPVEGRVKTRLTPPLTPAVAARCYRAFVTDTLTRLGRLGPRVDRVVAVAPNLASAPSLAAVASANGWRCVEQDEGHLGERMRALTAAGVRDGVRVVIVGSDTPDLPLGLVTDALRVLDDEKLVLGPASDGGYYLVGCRDRVPEIFGPEMPWGGATLWRETLARLREDGEAAAILPPWHDVDDWPTLRALASRIERPHGDRVGEDDDQPVATLRLIAELRAAGLDL